MILVVNLSCSGELDLRKPKRSYQSPEVSIKQKRLVREPVVRGGASDVHLDRSR